MKQIVLLFSLVCLLLNGSKAFAQTFNLKGGDTVLATVSSGENKIYNNIENTGSANIKVTWKIVDHNFPPSWYSTSASFGICDNSICYANQANNALINGSIQTTQDIAPTTTADFHMQINLDAAPNGTHYLRLEMSSDANNVKNPVFVVTKGTTGLTTVTRSDDDIVFYPNPARDALNVIFDAHAGVRTISVHNMIGKVVDVFKVSSGSAKLDLTELPSGPYFIRLADGDGRVVGTRKFTRQ